MMTPTMQPILPLWGESDIQAAGAGQSRQQATLFSDVLQAAVDNVRQTDAVKNDAQYRLATGQLDNPAELTIAATQASVAVELLVQLRDRALDAYSELTRISM